jgi:leader peptidase (prepilin peptidase)/N-methyltransferase
MNSAALYVDQLVAADLIEFSLLFFIILTGLVLGSFATALFYRVPRDISFIGSFSGKTFSRSSCVSCQHPLSVKDLVPLFSWLMQKGRCRYCGKAIGYQYPAIEVLTLLMCIFTYLCLGFGFEAIIIIFISPILIALLAIDLKHYVLPDILVGVIGAAGLFYLGGLYYWENFPLERIFLSHLLGGFVYAALVFGAGYLVKIFKKKEALGLGDVKLFFVAGLWLGIEGLPYFLILSGGCGVIFGLIWQFAFKKQVFPFGPALIIAFYLTLIAENTSLQLLNVI